MIRLLLRIKKKYDILVKIKKINKNKLINNLNNLNSEKEKLEDVMFVPLLKGVVS